MTRHEKLRVIMQLGEFCTTTICHKGCPIYKSKYQTNLHNSCMECLRFPEIAEQMADKINRIPLGDYDD